MNKESGPTHIAETLERVKTRLETGAVKARAVRDATTMMLHSDEPIDTETLPFTVLPKYDTGLAVDEFDKFDVQLNISHIAEQITDRTIPVIEEKIAGITTAMAAVKTSEQLTAHKKRIDRMREQFEKGHFPEKTLREAEEKLQELMATQQTAKETLLVDLVATHAARVSRIRSGRERGLFTETGLHVAEKKLESSQQKLVHIKPVAVVQPEQVVDTAPIVLNESVTPPMPLVSTATETKHQVTTSAEERQKIQEELAKDFEGDFFEKRQTQRAESFYTFLEDAIRSNNGRFTLPDLAFAMYSNEEFSVKARTYFSSPSKRDEMRYRGWEIVALGKRGEKTKNTGVYCVRKIDDQGYDNTDEGNDDSDSYPYQELAHDNDEREVVSVENTSDTTQNKPWIKYETHPTRVDALAYIAETPDWTTDDVVALLGPSASGRDLQWQNASIALRYAVSRMFSRTRLSEATEAESQTWHKIAQSREEQGKDALLAFREELHRELKLRDSRLNKENKNKKKLKQSEDVFPAPTVQQDEIKIPHLEVELSLESFEIDDSILTEHEVDVFGALLTDLHSVTIKSGNISTPFRVDSELISQFATQRSEFRQLVAAEDPSVIAEIIDKTVAKVNTLFSQPDTYNISDTIEQQPDDAFLLLYSVAENNDLFGGLFLDFVREMSQKSWEQNDTGDWIWNAPHDIPLFMARESETDTPARQLVTPEPVIFESGTAEIQIKQKRIEKEYPDVRTTLQELFAMAYESLPQRINIGQIRSYKENKYAKTAVHALEHNYISGTHQGGHVEFNRTDLVVIEFLTKNEKILKQPKLVKELLDILKQEQTIFFSENPQHKQ